MTSEERWHQLEAGCLLLRLNLAFRTGAHVRWARLSASECALMPAVYTAKAAVEWEWGQGTVTRNTGGFTVKTARSTGDMFVRVDMPRERVLETTAHEFYHWLEGDHSVPDRQEPRREWAGYCSLDARRFGKEVSRAYLAGRFTVPPWVVDMNGQRVATNRNGIGSLRR